MNERPRDPVLEPKDAEVDAPDTSGASGASGASPTRQRARWPLIAGGLTLAAVVLLGVSLRRSEEPLPLYEPDFVTGAKAAPSDPPGQVRLVPGGSLQAAMRPRSPVEGALAARAWLVRGDEAITLRSEVELSPDGALKITATPPAGRVIAPGPADLVVLVCRPKALPAESTTRAPEVLGVDEDRCRTLQRGITVEGG